MGSVPKVEPEIRSAQREKKFEITKIWSMGESTRVGPAQVETVLQVLTHQKQLEHFN